VSVANLTRRAGVMVRGQWLPKSEIDRQLADLAALLTAMARLYGCRLSGRLSTHAVGLCCRLAIY
jgi:hypothetical protein